MPIDKKGIVIVATGHPYYGRMAYNLCLSIKAVEKQTKVCILYNGNALAHIGQHQTDIIDYIIRMDDSIPANQCSKLYATKYTPFEKTLLLDADTLWLPNKKPSELFQTIGEDVNFTAITEGHTDEINQSYFFWADVGEIREVYGVNKIYQWRTEVMYFNVEGRKVLEKALEITKEPKLKSVTMFAYNVPDELGINIATAIYGIEPHQYKWQPTFWYLMNKSNIPEPRKIYENYYLLSFGSNFTGNVIKKLHDSLLRNYCMKLQRQHVFPLHNKRDFLPKLRDKM